ncbi:NucA/NucB deoxyribonuclease domain-containing protein [Micromonospora zamorensis]|uniref:NucA/NucB deoxyribonuclease domain-containing protein n=1 Tax=Micromonospora zamorensis TaxID=709883 RepID=UPI003CF51CD9
MADHRRTRYFSRSLRATALAVALVLPVTLISAPPAQAAPEAVTEAQLPACADPSVPEDINHASIRLEGPTAGSEVAVDANGKIAINGYLHKQATMVDVSIEKTTSSSFTFGPPPPGVTNWSASWTTSMRPPHLGPVQVCSRAQREPGRYAKILRDITVVDLIPPSNVPSLAVGTITATSAKVTWGAATDNYGLAGYEVTVDGGTPQRTTVGTRSYSITGLQPTSNHTVSVVAIDLAGNRSATPARASFTTDALPPPPDVDAGLTLDPDEGGATASWHPDPTKEASYRAYLDDQIYDQFSVEQLCEDGNGNVANPCTADSVIKLPIEPLEEYTPYAFRVEALRADGTVARELAGDFTTMIHVDEVSPATTQTTASETSQCAGAGGDFYIAASARSTVPVPAGSTEVFLGCYRASNSSCLDAFLPPSGEKLLDCADNITDMLFAVAPSGRGPVISSVDAPQARLLVPSPVAPIAWCASGACATLLAPIAETVEVVAVAPAAAAGISWIVVGAAGIGIGLVLGVLLAILFPSTIGVNGLIEYPIEHDVDFDTFDNWGLDEGEWYNSLKVYAEVIKTTKLVADQRDLDFAWDSSEDSRLKRIIDAACTAQRGTQGKAGCDDNVIVYVPGAKNYRGADMTETGRHIVTAMGDGGFPQPPTRAVWFYPARSEGGQAARSRGYTRSWFSTPQFMPNACDVRVPGQTCDEFPFWSTDQAVDLTGQLASLKLVSSAESLPQGNDLSAFYGKCKVTNETKFIVLPVKPWVEAGGLSFAFKVSGGGASLCMTPVAP